MEEVRITVKVSLPEGFDHTGIDTYDLSLSDICSYADIYSEYSIILKKNKYFPIKDPEFRWLFFSDITEPYDKGDIDNEELILTPVFNQKWYKNKYMRVLYIDKNFAAGSRIIPTSKQEYNEDKKLYSALYRILNKNESHIGKYLK